MTLPKNKADWPEDAVEDFNERASIIEFHGDRTKKEAERLAEARVRKAWSKNE